MDLADRIDAVRKRLVELDGHQVGLVPTMGNLHEGHLELVRACRRHCDVCVVSIFVNPTQFGPNEDFANYPRTLDDDLTRLDQAHVDVVFKPGVGEMYPDGQQNHVAVTVPGLANTLCGASRPGHFDAVATVVAKLFNIVRPQHAFFGEKDWQQLTVIRAMVRQLDMPIDVVGVATVRAESGLALSSRNNYLSDAERDRAPLLNAALEDIKRTIEARRPSGNRQYQELEDQAATSLTDGGFDVDYVAVRDAHRLCAPDAASTDLRILAAARLGGARLIDNVGVQP